MWATSWRATALRRSPSARRQRISRLNMARTTVATRAVPRAAVSGRRRAHPRPVPASRSVAPRWAALAPTPQVARERLGGRIATLRVLSEAGRTDRLEVPGDGWIQAASGYGIPGRICSRVLARARRPGTAGRSVARKGSRPPRSYPRPARPPAGPAGLAPAPRTRAHPMAPGGLRRPSPIRRRRAMPKSAPLGSLDSQGVPGSESSRMLA